MRFPVTWAMPDEVGRILREATKEPLLSAGRRDGETVLDRRAVLSLLPHRDPFLFIDRVTLLDVEQGLIAARFDLSRAPEVFAAHFPDRPVWPGVLQVEGIAQAASLLVLKRAERVDPTMVTLTHVQGARFLRPVAPGAELEILARVLDDGLLYTVVGQCLQGGEVCSVASVTILYE